MAGTSEDWDRSFDVNGKGVYLCYKHAAKQMIKQGRGGRIIGACSLAGKQGLSLSNRTLFEILLRFWDRKTPVIHLQRNKICCPLPHRIRGWAIPFNSRHCATSGYKAIELGKYGITVNAYAPGQFVVSSSHTRYLMIFQGLWTHPWVGRIYLAHFQNKAHLHHQVDQYVQDTKKWGGTDALYQSVVSGEEVAALVSYLVSKDAKNITGKSLPTMPKQFALLNINLDLPGQSVSHWTNWCR